MIALAGLKATRLHICCSPNSLFKKKKSLLFGKYPNFAMPFPINMLNVHQTLFCLHLLNPKPQNSALILSKAPPRVQNTRLTSLLKSPDLYPCSRLSPCSRWASAVLLLLWSPLGGGREGGEKVSCWWEATGRKLGLCFAFAWKRQVSQGKRGICLRRWNAQASDETALPGVQCCSRCVMEHFSPPAQIQSFVTLQIYLKMSVAKYNCSVSSIMPVFFPKTW